ncbi:MAG: hypothetical protein H7269_11210, partial [Cellulomonas sp.]|nr:hypothetical protein [Cellulomonas sp.]
MRALDDTDELLLTGRAVPPTEAGLAGFVADLRATAAEPAPRPSAALSALLRDGLPPSPVPVRSVTGARPIRASAWSHPWRTAAGLGLAGRIVLGAGGAVASVGGAAAIDGVPDVVQRPARAVVSGVAGLFTTDPAAREPDAPGSVAPVGPRSTADPSPAATSSPTATPPGTDPNSDVPAEGNPLPARPLPRPLPVPVGPLPEITVSPLPAQGPPTDLATVVPGGVGLLRSGVVRSPALPPTAVVPPPRGGPPVAVPGLPLAPSPPSPGR